MTEQTQKISEVNHRKDRSCWGRSMTVLLCLLLYVLSEPWAVFGLYKLSPTLPDRLMPVYVVVYAPNHFLASHSDIFLNSYQQYCDTLEKMFPGFFDWTAFRGRHSAP